MRGDAHVVGLGHGRDLLGFAQAAGVADVRLDDIDDLLLDQAAEALPGVQAFAGSHRGLSGVGDLFHGADVEGIAWLFDPGNTQVLVALAQADGFGSGHAAAEVDVHLGRVTGNLHQLLDPLVGQFGEVAVMGPPLHMLQAAFVILGSQWVALECLVTVLHWPFGCLCPGRGVEAVVVPTVGVDRGFIEDLATEEFIDRQIGGLALDVPQGGLDGTDPGEDDGAAALGPEGVVVHLRVQLFDAERVRPDDHALAQVFDHAGRCGGAQPVGDGQMLAGYVAFQMVVVAALRARMKGWKPAGAFSLGRWGWVVNLGALAYGIFACVVLSLPSSNSSLGLLDRWIALVGLSVVVVTGLLYMVIAKPHRNSTAPEADAVEIAHAMRECSGRSRARTAPCNGVIHDPVR